MTGTGMGKLRVKGGWEQDRQIYELYEQNSGAIHLDTYIQQELCMNTMEICKLATGACFCMTIKISNITIELSVQKRLLYKMQHSQFKYSKEIL